MKQTEHAARLLASAQRVVVFTGAGISTESGIPDFRSPNGVWARYQPVYFADFMNDPASRHEYWRQKCEAHTEFASALPNGGHQLLARWEQSGRIRGIVTQNIDGLHQLAGSQQVLELHGTARYAQCMHCGVRSPIQPWVEEFLATDLPPRCLACNGPLKHATISFGQALDQHVIDEAQQWMQETTLVLALGSSLVVHPAAGLPEMAKRRGADLIIINRDATPLDELADLVIRQSLGETLQEIDRALAQESREV